MNIHTTAVAFYKVTTPQKFTDELKIVILIRIYSYYISPAPTLDMSTLAIIVGVIYISENQHHGESQSKENKASMPPKCKC